MRLASFEVGGQAGYGVVTGSRIARMDRLPGAAPDLRQAIARYCESGWPEPPTGGDLAIDDVTLLPPVPDPGKVICVATNFHEEALKDRPIPEYPLVFTRFAESFTGSGQPLIKPAVSEKFDFEGELAVIIGKPGHKISREAAMTHVAGYTCLNDGSARDWQKHSSQFTPGKNFFRSGGMGPWMVTADDIPDLGALKLETRVNGAVKQAIDLNRMIFDVPWLIAYLSTITPLSSGDIIATGTPSGFGSSRTPPEFLAAGDVIEVEITGIGVLRNRVDAEQAL